MLLAVGAECRNPAPGTKHHRGAVHPWTKVGNRDPVRIEHVVQHRCIKDQITFHQQERFVNLLPGQPQGIEVVGSAIVGADDVIDLHVARFVAQKFPDFIALVSNYHHQPINALFSQVVNQPIEDRAAANLGEALRGTSGRFGSMAAGEFLSLRQVKSAVVMWLESVIVGSHSISRSLQSRV